MFELFAGLAGFALSMREDKRRARKYDTPAYISDWLSKVYDEQLVFDLQRENMADHPEWWDWVEEEIMESNPNSIAVNDWEPLDSRFMSLKLKHKRKRDYVKASDYDYVFLHREGKLSLSEALVAASVPAESGSYLFTQDVWNQCVERARRLQEIIRSGGVDADLVVYVPVLRNRNEFFEMYRHQNFYLDKVDYEFIFDLYKRHGEVGTYPCEIRWGPLVGGINRA